jgi:hypothetical protein
MWSPGTGTAKDPRTSTRYHLRLLEKNVLQHMYRGDVGGELAPYRSPRFSRRSRALLSAFKRCLRRMLASDLVRALANRCLRDMPMAIAHLLARAASSSSLVASDRSENEAAKLAKKFRL